MQPLTAGDNTITLTTIGSNGGNFDELGISGIQNTSGIDKKVTSSKSVRVLKKKMENYPFNSLVMRLQETFN
jgi:hypothetical protein